MVSRRKRSSYVTESEYSSDEDMVRIAYNQRNKVRNTTKTVSTPKFEEHMFDNSQIEQELSEELSNQGTENGKMKCTSRNAIIARKNRIRKKMYIQNLEDEVTKLRNSKEKLSAIINNQSFLISELRKEVKYMKSVLANSSDISNLIKNIRNNTGMSVTTSLDKTLTMNNNCVSKQKETVARKTAHPWEDQSSEDYLDNSISKTTTGDVSPRINSEEFNLPCGFDDLDIPIDLDIPFPEFPLNLDESETSPLSFETLDGNDQNNINFKIEETANTWDEHNYTVPCTSDFPIVEDEVGVCLHVSQHRVSLEFCPTCSENAIRTWKELK